MLTTQNTHHANPNQDSSDNSWLRTWGTKVAAIPLIVLFVISSIVAYQSVQAVHDQDQRVDHNRLVVVTIGVVNADLYGAQAEAYNYVISGDISQFQAFLQLRPQVSSDLATLTLLLRSSPVQQGWVRTLRSLIPQELGALQNAVNLRRSGATEAALHLVATGTDDKVAATNQALIEALDNSGTRDLRQQMASASTTVRVTTADHSGGLPH